MKRAVSYFALAMFMGLSAPITAQRWSRTYDALGLPNGITSLALTADTCYVFSNLIDVGTPGYGYRFTKVDGNGNVLIEHDHELEPLNGYYGGLSHSLIPLPYGGFLMGSTYLLNGDANGLLIRYSSTGDTLWTKHLVIDTVYNTLSSIDEVEGAGYALFGSYRPLSKYDAYLVRIDTMGNELWSRTYGGIEDQQCVSGQHTLDGGFVLAGYNYYNNANSDLYVVKVDSAGVQEWSASYGSPWLDNAGFITQLPDSGYILAGGERVLETGNHRACMYRLDPVGGVIWSSVFLDWPERSVFFAKPIATWDGYVGAGTQSASGIPRGMLLKCDLVGDLVWRRAYQTNSQLDHYFYDVKRTLDGGYIMAGSAFDSLLASQDAWLVKVDSFGCLVPGCQVFDGLQEQFTDLREVLTLYPNPVASGAPLQVDIKLPSGFSSTGVLALGLVSSEGRLVREQALPKNAGRTELSTFGLSPGLYFIHLRDGARWLSGVKVVVE